MLRKLARLIVITPFFFAFQCEEEPVDQLVYNDFKVEISTNAAITTSDIIWIEGLVSSRVFNLTTGDSVFAETPAADVFLVYKLMDSDGLSNAWEALDKFTLTYERGEYSFLPQCENAQVQVIPALENNELFYSYRIGLKPLEAGDYVISWQSAELRNENRNTFIIEDYPIANHPGQIGFNTCGQVSWRFLNESEREFYFTITP